MPQFLIDANLPRYFSLWNSTEYTHQMDIQADAEDIEIWNIAKEKNLTIITKDADFSNLVLLHTPPPRVIHLRIGNLSMRDFHVFISSIWAEVIRLNQTNKLVVVFRDHIETIA
jgi:predicted nuclease of predicted toxin-antitoxin system